VTALACCGDGPPRNGTGPRAWSPQPAQPPGSGQHRPGTAALEALYLAHYQQLVRLALLVLGGDAFAEDIVQEAFIRVHGSLSSIRDPERAASYLRVTTMNLARSALRRQQTALRHAPAPPAEPAGPEELAVASDREAGLLAALRLLPCRQRQVIVLRYYADLSVLETARTLRISTGSVKTHGSRALAALADVLRQAS
jgi:RNA polymerase sigma-70 factor (sigma-E family)